MTEEKNPAVASDGAKEADLGNASEVDATHSASSAPVQSVLDQRLSAEHFTELQTSAISDDVIEASGAYTAWERDDLPDPLRWVGDRDGALPALVFPLTEAGKGETWQAKPQPGFVTLTDGRSPKYIGPSKDSGYPTPALIERRAVDDTTRRVLVVEGTKQALAVMSATDESTAVYGLSGITSWMGGDDGPSSAFQLVGGLPVYIVADADAARNRRVYDGAAGIGELCRQWGASPVRFVRFPGSGKQGIDDVLGGIDSPAQREKMLELWVKQAEDKPAKKRPSLSSTIPTKDTSQGSDGSAKPIISTDLPDDQIWDAVDNAVYEKFAGKRLFRTDHKLVCLVHRDGRKHLIPVSNALAVDLSAQAIRIVHSTQTKSKVRALSDKDAATIFNGARVGRYPRIEGIVETPVLTPSGRVLSEPGYDEETGLLLDLSDDLDGFHVPDDPSQEEVTAARELLEEVYADFPFKTEADRTRAIGMVLTLLVRPSCETSPMHVISANTPGTGKGLLLSAVSMIAHGYGARVQKMPHHDEEMQKVLTSALLAGQTMLIFDETGEGIGSLSLAAMLTSTYYEGRILGESRHLSVKNSACVFAAGNNVAVKKDLGRRTVMVEMKTPLASPEARDDFTHPDLLVWVKDNRRALLEAAFTLIRAWIVAGEPAPAPGQPVGSFEDWYHVVGGVLEHAGRRDLMFGVREQRAQHNESELEDLAHLHWVSVNFDEPFRAYDVECKIRETQGFIPLPSDIQTLDEVTAQRLGRVYTKLQDRNLAGFVVKMAGMVNHTKRFKVTYLGPDGNGGGPGGLNDPDGGSPTPPPAPGCSAVDADNTGASTVVFDLETASADGLHTTDDPAWVRLAAYQVDGGEIRTTTDIAGELLPVLRNAGTIVGHNITHFDLPALERQYGFAPSPEQRVEDTLVLARLVDPPTTGKKYHLDAVATRLGLDGKLLADGDTALKALASQHGGFDQIPVDDPQYVAYARQDVRATADVHCALVKRVPDAEYVAYEHEVARVLAGVESRGIRVDVDLVEETLADEDTVKTGIRGWLVNTVGIPDEGKAPWATKAGKEAIQSYLQRYGAQLPLTKTGAPTTTKDAFRELAEQHADTREVVEVCENMVALLETRSPAKTVKKYLRSDRVFPSIQPSQATGRLSTTKPGMTIFGSRGERLLAQRAMILPEPGERLLSVDLSQIDARCMAAAAGDEAYAALFSEGRDAHTEMAVRVFGDPARRPDAKALAHAANYGMGARSFAAHVGCSVAEAERMLSSLHLEFPRLESFKEQLRKGAETSGYVTTGFGRRVAVNRDKAYTRAPAAYGQGTARDVFLHGVLAMPEDVQRMIRIFVHDEVVLSVPKDRVEEVRQCVLDAFSSVALPSADGVHVPVLADSAGPGRDWSECK